MCLEVKPHAFLHSFFQGLILEMSILSDLVRLSHLATGYVCVLCMHIMHAAPVPA